MRLTQAQREMLRKFARSPSIDRVQLNQKVLVAILGMGLVFNRNLPRGSFRLFSITKAGRNALGGGLKLTPEQRKKALEYNGPIGSGSRSLPGTRRNPSSPTGPTTPPAASPERAADSPSLELSAVTRAPETLLSWSEQMSDVLTDEERVGLRGMAEAILSLPDSPYGSDSVGAWRGRARDMAKAFLASLASQTAPEGWKPISEYKRGIYPCVFRYAPTKDERNMLPEHFDTDGPSFGFRKCTHFLRLPDIGAL